MSEWIKCSDRLPKLASGDPECTGYVLVYQTYFGSRFVQAFHDCADDAWYDEQGELIDGEVSHWMPLPAPPSKDQP